jgi:hypothetical protein
MNKDAILATIIGFVIGLGITGLVLAGPALVKNFPKISLHLPSLSTTKQKPTPSAPPVNKTFSLSINSPIAESIESGNTLLVSGTTVGGSTVVISGVTDDAVTIATTDGKYVGKIALIEGENTILVTSYNKKDRANQNVTVYYTKEQF